MAHLDRSPASSAPTMHIGEVAERVGLSLRTVRYYEEQGLIAPEARTEGGFRLYTDAQAERLRLIKQMKPLGFPVASMRELLDALDAADDDATTADDRAAAEERLAGFATAAAQRCVELREQLAIAEGLAATLDRRTTDTGT